MGKHAANKVLVGLYVEKELRDKLDALAKVWGFPTRTTVIMRLLSYSIGEVDRLSPMPKRPGDGA